MIGRIRYHILYIVGRHTDDWVFGIVVSVICVGGVGMGGRVARRCLVSLLHRSMAERDQTMGGRMPDVTRRTYGVWVRQRNIGFPSAVMGMVGGGEGDSPNPEPIARTCIGNRDIS